MLPAVAVTLSADDRQQALTAAAEAANPDRGRTVFVQTLAIAAFQQFWSWLELGPDCSAIEGLPGEVGLVGLAQGGSIALLPLLPDAADPVGIGPPPELTVDWPLDWPDDVVAFVPVAVSRSLDQAWLWGWISVGDLNLPPAPAQPSLGAVLQDWEFLEPYLWRMAAALTWIAEATDPLAQQVRQAIAPDQRMGLVASLDRQYRQEPTIDDLASDPTSSSVESSDPDSGDRADDVGDLSFPDLSQDESTPLAYRYPVERPTAKVREAANPYRAKADDPNDPNALQDPAWQELAAPLLERLLPIWDLQGDYVEPDVDANFSDDLDD